MKSQSLESWSLIHPPRQLADIFPSANFRYCQIKTQSEERKRQQLTAGESEPGVDAL